MGVRHSAWTKPGTLELEGGPYSDERVRGTVVFANPNVNTLILLYRLLRLLIRTVKLWGSILIDLSAFRAKMKPQTVILLIIQTFGTITLEIW
jgi:hypothetical protein